ncbi:unnamed protein product [Linum trigynum]|uniref:Reverse transcriptase zinc-binding domain-containing protein n=1 Tax=Linum trigynum TaxID=586398 RepID=A0AAV2E3X9_9ROSI
MYRCLRGEAYKGLPNFHVGSVWRLIVPTKICSFIWLVAHKRIFTIDNLKKRSLSLANICEMCSEDEETINHIFIHCKFNKDVWDRLRRACGSLETPVRDIFEVISRWPTNCTDDGKSWIRYGVLHSVCWQIWLERNNRIFREVRLQAKVVARKALMDVVEWSVAGGIVDKS